MNRKVAATSERAPPPPSDRDRRRPSTRKDDAKHTRSSAITNASQGRMNEGTIGEPVDRASLFPPSLSSFLSFFLSFFQMDTKYPTYR